MDCSPANPLPMCAAGVGAAIGAGEASREAEYCRPRDVCDKCLPALSKEAKKKREVEEVLVPVVRGLLVVPAVLYGAAKKWKNCLLSVR